MFFFDIGMSSYFGPPGILDADSKQNNAKAGARV